LKEYVSSNDTPVKSVKFNVGGSAFNTANALAKMGQKVNLICSLGKDIEGKYIKDFSCKIKKLILILQILVIIIPQKYMHR